MRSQRRAGVIGTEERGGLPVLPRADVQAPPHWRLDAIAATERPRDLALAPGSGSVAFILDRETSDVWALEPGSAPRRLTTDRAPVAHWDDTTPSWSPDAARIAYVNEGAVFVVDASGGVPRRLCEAGNPIWLDERVLVATAERDRRTRLVLVDTEEPWPAPLAGGDGDCFDATVSPDRTSVAYTFAPHADRSRTEVHVVDIDTGDDTALTGTTNMQDHGPAWSPDGRRIAFVSERPGWYEIFVVDATGGARDVQLTHDDADFGSLEWSADGTLIAATRNRRGVIDLVTVDAKSGEVFVRATGGTWGPPHWLPDSSLLATYEDASTPPQVRVVTAGGEVHVALAPAPAAIVAAPHVVPERVTFESFDGVEIEAILYRPPNASPDRPVPAVVNPHGGPTDRDGDEWYGHAQYFVAKGYAWLLPNFRGSTSYGRDFERLNHGVWGVDDTKDCLAAYDFLAGLDWVDEDRIGIFGGSYGSYLALCSVVDDPRHRYKCAVTKYGDCDILTSWAQGDREGVQDLERMMRHPSDARAAYRAGSPIHRIDALSVPVLVAHGELDERVHPAQSRRLVDALARLGKTYEYVTYPTEGHGFLRAAPQIDFFRRLERFLDWWLL